MTEIPDPNVAPTEFHERAPIDGVRTLHEFIDVARYYGRETLGRQIEADWDTTLDRVQGMCSPDIPRNQGKNAGEVLDDLDALTEPGSRLMGERDRSACRKVLEAVRVTDIDSMRDEIEAFNERNRPLETGELCEYVDALRDEERFADNRNESRLEALKSIRNSLRNPTFQDVSATDALAELGLSDERAEQAGMSRVPQKVRGERAFLLQELAGQMPIAVRDAIKRPTRAYEYQDASHNEPDVLSQDEVMAAARRVVDDEAVPADSYKEELRPDAGTQAEQLGDAERERARKVLESIGQTARGTARIRTALTRNTPVMHSTGETFAHGGYTSFGDGSTGRHNKETPKHFDYEIGSRNYIYTEPRTITPRGTYACPENIIEAVAFSGAQTPEGTRRYDVNPLTGQKEAWDYIDYAYNPGLSLGGAERHAKVGVPKYNTRTDTRGGNILIVRVEVPHSVAQELEAVITGDEAKGVPPNPTVARQFAEQVVLQQGGLSEEVWKYDARPPYNELEGTERAKLAGGKEPFGMHVLKPQSYDLPFDGHNNWLSPTKVSAIPRATW